MTSFEEALSLIENHVKPTGETETVGILDALGCVIASEVHAPFALPRFDSSAVDGYAVLVSDLDSRPAQLQLRETVFAGAGDRTPIEPGTTAKVMTGAIPPVGTEAVVMREDVEEADGIAAFTDPVKPGQNIRRAGEELSAGDLIIEKGTVLNSAHLSLISSFGLDEVHVVKRPKVSILATGSELRSPGDDLAEGEIYESNGVGLAARVKSLGLPSAKVTRCEDSLEETTAAVEEAARQADVVVTSGGASVGDKDWVREAAKACGFEEIFWRVQIKPGKPAALMVRPSDGTALFALPGNPVSALVTMELYVVPALRVLTGRAFASCAPSSAHLAERIEQRAGRLNFVRGTVLSDGTVMPVKGQGSHMMSGLAKADVLIAIPADASVLEARDTVKV